MLLPGVLEKTYNVFQDPRKSVLIQHALQHNTLLCVTISQLRGLLAGMQCAAMHASNY
jgi:hypothetical protein